MGLSAHGFVICKEGRLPGGPWVSTTPKFSLDNAARLAFLSFTCQRLHGFTKAFVVLEESLRQAFEKAQQF